MQQFINKSGFTLVEITLALLILAVGLVGILTLFPVGFDALARSANITKATFLAQEKMEDLKREGYGGPTVGTIGAVITATHGSYPDPNLGSSGNFGSDYPNYEYDIFGWDGILDTTAARVFTGSICEVKIVVYWPANAGEPGPPKSNRDGQRKVELYLYIAKYGP